MTDLKYKRLLVKLSGEALMGQYDFGIDPSVIAQLSRELEGLQQAGVELGVVVGGRLRLGPGGAGVVGPI